jgi:hypothetical protein
MEVLEEEIIKGKMKFIKDLKEGINIIIKFFIM